MKKADRGSSARGSAKAVGEVAQQYHASSAMVSTSLDDVIARAVKRGSLASRRPTDEQIERAAADDPDAPLLTAQQLSGGRTVLPESKVAISLRIDRAVVDAYKATGRGWQTRMNDALAASIPAVPGDTGETIRALERTVQSAAQLLQQLKLEADGLATPSRGASTRAATSRSSSRPSRKRQQ